MPQEKLPQIKFYLTKEQYEKLKVIAKEQGLSIPGVAKRLTLEYLGEIDNTGLVAHISKLEAQIKDLETRDKQMANELGRLERDYATLIRNVKEIERKRA
ncbi:MAG: hypothetical protein HYY22_10060 [Thaumarchaeota archaeon]|nr:hypothetical protein [Nitrososphaerota archaeon]